MASSVSFTSVGVGIVFLLVGQVAVISAAKVSIFQTVDCSGTPVITHTYTAAQSMDPLYCYIENGSWLKSNRPTCAAALSASAWSIVGYSDTVCSVAIVQATGLDNAACSYLGTHQAIAFYITLDCGIVPSLPVSESSSGSCFPGQATVIMANGTQQTMAQLQIGDRVRVGPDSEQSEIYMFSHRYPEATHVFVALTTAIGKVIHLSKGHYLYVNGSLNTAENVKIGDNLDTADGTRTSVVDIQTAVLQGLHNPHTMQGDIIVDGIRTSTYTDALSPILAHAVLAPVRAMHTLRYDLIGNREE